MSTLSHHLAPYVTLVEQEMRARVPALDENPAFYGQLYYHMGWASQDYEPGEYPTGKRVRSAFCLMVCELFAGTVDPALPAAAAIEMLHQFSLIHDDIEDGDRRRHHRPTLWTIVGQPQAINAGDGLFALAQLALLDSAERGVEPARVLRAQRRFNETAIALCVGQQRDMSFERRDTVAPEEYLEMIDGKTASLLAFSGEAGALMAGARETEVARLGELGRAMGLAFQMRDDLLGLWGDSQRTGKPVGADIRARKKSLPVTYALSREESDRLRDLYAGPLSDEHAVAEALELIEASGARDFVLERAARHEARAHQILDDFDVGEERLAPLRALVHALTQRDH